MLLTMVMLQWYRRSLWRSLWFLRIVGQTESSLTLSWRTFRQKKLRPILGISPLTSTSHQMEPSGGSGITAGLYQTGSTAWLPCSRAVGSTTALTQLPLTLQWSGNRLQTLLRSATLSKVKASMKFQRFDSQTRAWRRLNQKIYGSSVVITSK